MTWTFRKCCSRTACERRPSEGGQAWPWEGSRLAGPVPVCELLLLSSLQELGYVDLLEQEEVQAGVYAANEKGDQEHASKSCQAPPMQRRGLVPSWGQPGSL